MIVTEVFDGRDTNKDGKLTKAEWDVPGTSRETRYFAEPTRTTMVWLPLQKRRLTEEKSAWGKPLRGTNKNHDAVRPRRSRADHASKEGERGSAGGAAPAVRWTAACRTWRGAIRDLRLRRRRTVPPSGLRSLQVRRAVVVLRRSLESKWESRTGTSTMGD